jgi:hypothetical protein
MYKQDSNKLVQTTRTTTITSHKTVTVDDYRNNVASYPQWQKFLRERHPDTTIFWGQNDIFFAPEGGDAYLRDLPNAEIHRLDSGHFAVEDCLEEISNNIVHFYESRVDIGKGVGMTVNSVSSPFDWECGPVLDEIWMTIGKIIFKYLINRDHHDKN